jgi:hypothetical protein
VTDDSYTNGSHAQRHLNVNGDCARTHSRAELSGELFTPLHIESSSTQTLTMTMQESLYLLRFLWWAHQGSNLGPDD